MEIKYETHPVSPERKAELRAQGYRILDAKFAPKGQSQPTKVPSREDIDKMPKAEVVEWLEAHGVEEAEGKVGDLRAMLIQTLFADL